MQMQSIEIKQSYLRDNIINNGYDPEDFIKFLNQSEKCGQINLQKWTLSQLKHLVQKYKQQKQNGLHKFQKNSKQILKQYTRTSQMIVHDKEIQKIKSEKKKIQYQRHSGLFDYEYVQTHPCIRVQKLFNQNHELSVPQYEIKQSQGFLFGIGSHLQNWYLIKSNKQSKQIKILRKQDDIKWLLSTITKINQIIAIPDLYQWSKQDTSQKKKQIIEEYLKHVYDRQELHHSHLLADFLLVNNDKFQRISKSYESMGFVKGVSLMKNTVGEVNVKLTNRIRNFSNASYNYIKKNINLHQNQSKSISKLLSSLSITLNDMNQVVDGFADLHDNYNQIANKFPQYKQPDYIEILINLNNLFHGMAENLRGRINSIDNQVKSYFRFIQKYDSSMLKLLKYNKECEKQYLDLKYQLKCKKEKIFMDSNKWGIDLKDIDIKNIKKEEIFELILPKQTQNDCQRRLWIGYLNTNFQQQFKIYIKTCTKKYAQKFKKFSTNLLDNQKQYLQTLTSFIGGSRKFC